jgi:hypothetical protein
MQRAPGLAPGADPGGILMNTWNRLKGHPWLTTGLVAATAAIALLFIPISYQRVTGSNVTLSLAGENLGPPEIQRVAQEIRGILQAGPIRVEAGDDGFTLNTSVEDRAWKQVARLALAYTKGLAERGIQAESRVTPRFEKAQGTVYAAAFNNIVEIRIQSEGKSDAEIAAEIQSQMLAAGLTNAEVSVQSEGDHRRIEIRAEKECGPDDPPCEESEPEFRISIDGKEPGEGDVDQRRVELRLNRTEGMTDEELLEQARQQLSEQGVDADVTMENGKVKVTPRN